MSTPSGRASMTLGFDSIRNVVILYGGTNSDGVQADLWEYALNDTSWTEVTTVHTPGPWAGGGYVWDSTRNRFLIINGINDVGAGQNTMWSYDGTDWTDITPVAMLPYANDITLAYDPVRDRVVATGGCSTLGGVWEYVPVSGWNIITPDGGDTVPNVSNPSFGYNPLNHLEYRSGGFIDSGTYSWNGTSWTALSGSGGYGNLNGTARIVWDYATNSFVTLCASDSDFTVPETRRWDDTGHAWEILAPVHTPSARLDYGFVSLGSGVPDLLFGGRDLVVGSYFDEIWFWDGTDWSQVASSIAPSDPPSDTPPNIVVLSRTTSPVVSRSALKIGTTGYIGLAFPFGRGTTSLPAIATDADLIQMSIKQIIFTSLKERVMRPNVGSSVMSFVFENNDTSMYHLLEIEIRSSVAKFEPRVRIESVSILPDSETESMVNVSINYVIILTQARDALIISLATQ